MAASSNNSQLMNFLVLLAHARLHKLKQQIEPSSWFKQLLPNLKLIEDKTTAPEKVQRKSSGTIEESLHFVLLSPEFFYHNFLKYTRYACHTWEAHTHDAVWHDVKFEGNYEKKLSADRHARD